MDAELFSFHKNVPCINFSLPTLLWAVYPNYHPNHLLLASSILVVWSLTLLPLNLFINIVTWWLKARIVEQEESIAGLQQPEQLATPEQRLYKNIPAATNTHVTIENCWIVDIQQQGNHGDSENTNFKFLVHLNYSREVCISTKMLHKLFFSPLSCILHSLPILSSFIWSLYLARHINCEVIIMNFHLPLLHTLTPHSIEHSKIFISGLLVA
jgi:hypothetical protein